MLLHLYNSSQFDGPMKTFPNFDVARKGKRILKKNTNQQLVILGIPPSPKNVFLAQRESYMGTLYSTETEGVGRCDGF